MKEQPIKLTQTNQIQQILFSHHPPTHMHTQVHAQGQTLSKFSLDTVTTEVKNDDLYLVVFVFLTVAYFPSLTFSSIFPLGSSIFSLTAYFPALIFDSSEFSLKVMYYPV